MISTLTQLGQRLGTCRKMPWRARHSRDYPALPNVAVHEPPTTPDLGRRRMLRFFPKTQEFRWIHQKDGISQARHRAFHLPHNQSPDTSASANAYICYSTYATSTYPSCGTDHSGCVCWELLLLGKLAVEKRSCHVSHFPKISPRVLRHIKK